MGWKADPTEGAARGATVFSAWRVIRKRTSKINYDCNKKETNERREGERERRKKSRRRSSLEEATGEQGQAQLATVEEDRNHEKTKLYPREDYVMKETGQLPKEAEGRGRHEAEGSGQGRRGGRRSRISLKHR